MRLGLWCAWTNGGLSTDPGALSVPRAGRACRVVQRRLRAPTGSRGRSGAASCAWHAPRRSSGRSKKPESLVAGQKLDYFKHDCGPIATACNKKTHRHHYGVDASYWATLGYYEVQESLLRTFPHLVLENCSGGGHIKDFGVIQRSHYTVDHRHALESPRPAEPLRFDVRPAAAGASGLHLRQHVPGRRRQSGHVPLAERDDERLAARPDRFGEMDGRRAAVAGRLRPDLQGVDSADPGRREGPPHPAAARRQTLGRHVPLERAADRKGRSIIFRPDSQDASRPSSSRGSTPTRQYWLWCEDGSIEPGVRTGQSLMEQGLAIQLARPVHERHHLRAGRRARQARRPGTAGAVPARPAEAKTDLLNVSMRPLLGAERARPGLSAHRRRGARLPQAGRREDRLRPGDDARWLEPGAEVFLEGRSRLALAGSQAEPTGRCSSPCRTGRSCPASRSPPTCQPVAATVGADNPLRKDHNLYNKPIAIAGKVYAKGLWTHSFNDARPADVVYDIAGKGFAALPPTSGWTTPAAAGASRSRCWSTASSRPPAPCSCRARSSGSASTERGQAGRPPRAQRRRRLQLRPRRLGLGPIPRRGRQGPV